MKTSTLLILSLCLTPLSVFAASGNVHGSPQGVPSGQANSSGMMMGAAPSRTDSPTQGAGPSGMRFNQISQGRPYITRAQARREDPTLYHHFKRCDALRDGRITRTEFKNCQGGLKK